MAETDRSGNPTTNFDARIQELRTTAQGFKTGAARDIVNGVIQLLETAWRVEKGGEGMASTSSRSGYDEKSSGR